MNDASLSRSRLLLGDSVMARLDHARVIIFGVGGVGSWCAESLVRTGLRHLTIVDADTVSESNINRQAMAFCDTVGHSKVDEMRRLLLAIRPDADITAIHERYEAETAARFDLASYDYVIDAIDSLRDKAQLILNATRAHTRLFSSMGAALKMDPTRIAVAEFYNVKGCPLAAALRQRFKRMGIRPYRKFKCVYSDELLPNRRLADDITADEANPFGKAVTNGSLMHATATFGLTLASLVIRDLYSRDGLTGSSQSGQAAE